MKNLVPEDKRIFNRPSNDRPISEFFDPPAGRFENGDAWTGGIEMKTLKRRIHDLGLYELWKHLGFTKGIQARILRTECGLS